jgi:hypothetical protein
MLFVPFECSDVLYGSVVANEKKLKDETLCCKKGYTFGPSLFCELIWCVGLLLRVG